ncbi:hypothetical protein DACRYDRAFT_96701 [Dacryopinax primogenitus]|uniref:Uncharacterized protein n=1 Tax=Dacryopinax primogenitus (strain DJM 731) TaxID=1858805 RepID=M5G2S5_DACPD|nr:uncharacterized protein DACRYDRAFT_96701 [Dacryopinax primogenitus]EJT98062.1 hypothetical protein DACRYDRAFT_96701 [Dacryopinax primogenitus]
MQDPSPPSTDDSPPSNMISPRQRLKQLSRLLAGNRPSKTRRRPRNPGEDEEEGSSGCHRRICRHCVGKETACYSTCLDCLAQLPPPPTF